jgi:LPS-assembly lipoprotein
VRRRHALLGLAAGLGGCGFRLREPLSLPFRRLALVGLEPRSPLGLELRRRLTGLVTIVATPAEAEVVLHVLQDHRQRVVAITTSAAQVREITLRLTLGVRADTPGGRVLMPPVTLRNEQDMSYNESAALAKAQEEQALFRDMQADVVGQLLRRLAAIQV